MPSYQDLESRVGVIERKLDFLFSISKVTKQTPTGMLDDHGRPLAKMETISLMDLYREVSATGTQLVEASKDTE